jgi:hypothetical protein
MKVKNSDETANKRLDRLLDEELRAIAQPPAVDLKTHVMAGLDERPGARFHLPAWTLAFAGAAAVVLAVVLLPALVRRQPPPFASGRAVLPSSQVAAGSLVPSSDGSRAAAVRTAALAGPSGRRARSRASSYSSLDAVPGALAAESNEPYLPGAPAGELGDPLQALPRPPEITFAPIQSAPPISDIARPVTDFPADNPPPAAPFGTAGQSGGLR